MALVKEWSFDDPTVATEGSVIIEENKVKVNYPCRTSTECTSIRMLFPAGKYLFELAGGSGYIIPRFFVLGERPEDSPLAGGYISGILSLKQKTNIIINIGGQGTNNLGGYNGGGGAIGSSYSCGGGGTDIRIGKNDPFHRILVAGGGGGSEDQNGETLERNDGNGGAGGGIQSKSFYLLGSYVSGFESNQTSGYSFFQGESGKAAGTSHPNGFKAISGEGVELSGGGGGWYGGFSSHHNDGGSSGGSSFALTTNSTLPIGIVRIFNHIYTPIQEDCYAFNPLSSPYLFYNVTHRRGVWNGNGFAVITRISNQMYCITRCLQWNGTVVFMHNIIAIFLQISLVTKSYHG